MFRFLKYLIFFKVPILLSEKIKCEVINFRCHRKTFVLNIFLYTSYNFENIPLYSSRPEWF